MAAWVRGFEEGAALDVRLLGLKGVKLSELTQLGLPIPPGFTVTTDVWAYHHGNSGAFPDGLESEMMAAMAHLEATMGPRFGDKENPLLLSVRSGARTIMPGMMDAVLNLGLNDETVEGLARISNTPRFAYDCYRRFIQMYSDVVLGVDRHHFEEILDEAKDDKGYYLDTEMQDEDWKKVVVKYKDLVIQLLGRPFPQDVTEQLWGAVGAVFGSWMNQRAITYRRLHEIPESWGTAVNVQAMVFGNMGDDCGAGICFTRNPLTGDNEVFGEFLVNAQGKEVLDGVRTPQQVTIAGKRAQGSLLPAMEEEMPRAFLELNAILQDLEAHYRDMQDVEFTVQQGRLWLLQTGTAKRTSAAAVRIAVSFANGGLITKNDAVMRVKPVALHELSTPNIPADFRREKIAVGLPASSGVGSGQICFSSAEVVALAARGKPAILVAVEVCPEDLDGMHSSRGIVTTRGGMTGHAAVVARGMGRPCVAGAGDILLDLDSRTLRVGRRILHEGDIITVDGFSGDVLIGAAPVVHPKMSGELETLISWADQMAGGVGALVHTLEGARRAYACGRRTIVISVLECMASQGAAACDLTEGVISDYVSTQQTLATVATSIRETIIDVVKAAGAVDVCFIIGRTPPWDEPPGLPSAKLYGRGSLALQPEFVFMQHAAVLDAIDSLVESGCSPAFTIAIANAFHSSDVELIRRWTAERRQRIELTPHQQIGVAGVIDTPHALIFYSRIFESVARIFIDIPSIARTLFLLPDDAVEAYQDFGNLDLGFEAGGTFDDVLHLLKHSLNSSLSSMASVELCALLSAPCSTKAAQILIDSGVGQLLAPAESFPGSILSFAQSLSKSTSS